METWMLNKRYSIEKLVSSISRMFVNKKQKKITDKIKDTLEILGNFTEVDRCYIFELDENSTMMSNTYEWCKTNIEPQIENLQSLSVDIFPWWINKLKNFEIIHIPDVSKLPIEAKAEKEILEMQSIKSLLVVPLVMNNKLLAFLGFDDVQKTKIWPDKDILLLQTIGDILVNALYQLNIENVISKKKSNEKNYQKALKKLTTNKLLSLGKEEEFAIYASKLISAVIKVDVVSVYQLDNKLNELNCINRYDKIKNLHTAQHKIKLGEKSKVLKAIENGETIKISEKQNHEILNELFAAEVINNKTKSIIISIMFTFGKIYGIVVCEQVGKNRVWTNQDNYFISFATEQIAGAVIHKERLEIFDKYKLTEEKLNQIIEHSSDIFFSHSVDNVMTYISPKASSFFECEPYELMKDWTEFLTDNPINQIGIESTNRAIKNKTKQPPYLLEIKSKKDKIFWIEVNESPVVENNKTTAIVGTIRDVTEKKKLDEELKRSNELYRKTVNEDITGNYVTNAEGKILVCNKAFANMLGYNSIKEIMKINVSKLYRSNSERDNFIKILKEKIKIDNSEHTLVKKNGEQIHIIENVFGEFDLNGEIEKIYGFMIDITDRKKAEIKLRESEELFRTVYENSTIGIYRTTPEGEFLMVNPAFLYLLGYSSIDELKSIGTSENLYINKETKTEFDRLIKNEGLVYDYNSDLVRKDGKIIYVKESARAIYNGNNNIMYYDGVVLDITKKKEAEEKLKMLAYAIESINECVSITDLDNRLVFVNKSFCKKYGYSEDEILGKHISIVRPPEREEEQSQILSFASKNGWRGETVNQKKDGTQFPVILSTSILKDEKGETNKLIGVVTDITEQKKAEEKIVKLSKAIEQNPVTIIITDKNGYIEYVNPKFEELTGYSYKEVVGKKPNILKSGEHDENFYKTLWDTILNGEDFHCEFRNKKKNGELYWENTVISPIINKDSAITHFIAVKEDITEKKKMLEELLEAKKDAEKSDKLKSEFLAQISHEIRTPLNGIISASQILVEDFEEMNKHCSISEDHKELLSILKHDSRRIYRTVDLILQMSKLITNSYDNNPQEIDIIERIIDFQFANYKSIAKEKGLTLTYEKDVNKIVLFIDEYSVTKIIEELLDNAIKFSKKGNIKLKVKLKEKGVFVEIKDMGIGIEEEKINSLFELFNQVERGYTRGWDGTGLGLALVKRYCELNNISIFVNSKVNKGTKFILSFPKDCIKCIE